MNFKQRMQLWSRTRPLPRRPRTFQRLRAAIVGNDKAAVVAVFGPPPATAGILADAEWTTAVPPYLRSNTWYYPLDKRDRSAMVIQFQEGVAREARVFHAPA